MRKSWFQRFSKNKFLRSENCQSPKSSFWRSFFKKKSFYSLISHFCFHWFSEKKFLRSENFQNPKTKFLMIFFQKYFFYSEISDSSCSLGQQILVQKSCFHQCLHKLSAGIMFLPIFKKQIFEVENFQSDNQVFDDHFFQKTVFIF